MNVCMRRAICVLALAKRRIPRASATLSDPFFAMVVLHLQDHHGIFLDQLMCLLKNGPVLTKDYWGVSWHNIHKCWLSQDMDDLSFEPTHMSSM